MKSPINNSSNTNLLERIEVNEIVKSYKRVYNIDVEKYFFNLKSIDVYICCDTGYRFYYPFNISGDSDFYIHFQNFDWYYMPWKWEHEVSLDLILPNYKVLEVGCGKGEFLKKIHKQKGVSCVGLELNETSSYQSDGVKIENTLVEKFSLDNKDQFDIVCSFQVLEHISSVYSFIQAQVDCLKKGGLLLVCVPNNESTLLKSKRHLLNMPPHHMGLWDEKSLGALEKNFNIRLKKIIFEPIQPYHFDMFTAIKLESYFGTLLTRVIVKSSKLLGLNKIVHKSMNRRASSIRGHSIMAVYEKI